MANNNEEFGFGSGSSFVSEQIKKRARLAGKVLKAKAKRAAKEMVKKAIKELGKKLVSGIASHPIVALIIAGLLLLSFSFFIMFGWSLKFHQSVMEISNNLSTLWQDITDGRKYRMKLPGEDELEEYGEDMVIVRYDGLDGSMDNEVSLKVFMNDPYGIKLLFDDDYAGILHEEGADEEDGIIIDTGDSVHLDDSDIYRIIDKLVEKEEEWFTGEEDTGGKRKYSFEHIHKQYRDGVDPDTGYHDGFYMWRPDDVWDDKDMSHWEIDATYDHIIKRIDIEGEKDINAITYKWLPKWQIIVGILDMLSVHQNDKWNNPEYVDGDEDFTLDDTGYSYVGREEWDLDGYYLSDTDIDKVIDFFWYEFSYIWDGAAKQSVNNTPNHIKYPKFEDISFFVDDVVEMADPPYPDAEAHIIKSPATSVKYITNGYTTVTYEYEDYTKYDWWSGYKICTGREIAIDAVALYDFLIELNPDFEWDYLEYILEMMPYSEEALKEVEELEAAYNEQKESGELVVEYQTTSFPSLGVILGTGTTEPEIPEERRERRNEWNPIDYELDGDGFYVWLQGKVYGAGYMMGWYFVPEEALKPITSDYLSQAEIKRMMEYTCGLFKSCPSDFPLMSDESALTIQKWQNYDSGSVSALCAIMRVEGTPGEKLIGREAWNFGNFAASSDEPCVTTTDKNGNTRRWVDFKTKYNGDFQAALMGNLQRFSGKWFARPDVYSMCFWDGSTSYQGQSPDEYNAFHFSNCYCPWWDDNSMASVIFPIPRKVVGGWVGHFCEYQGQALKAAGR